MRGHCARAGRQWIAKGVDAGGAVSNDCGNDRLSHQRLNALSTSHPRVAIHTTVASKATTSAVMQTTRIALGCRRAG